MVLVWLQPAASRLAGRGLARELYKYQEQSQLLDAYLESIVVPLATLLRRQALQQQDQSLHRVLGTCRLLNVLVVVRGYKTVVRFFPHEAADLERVVDILCAVRAQQPRDAEGGIALWEAQTILLLWLSILILIPFDLATLDSSTAAPGGEADKILPYTPLVGRILNLCQEYLHHPGGVREMAAVVLGRLLTRPDMGSAMAEFLEWCPGAVGGVDPLRQPFLLPGIMQALCCAFKLGQRDRLLPFASRAWALAHSLAGFGGSGSKPTHGSGSGSDQNALARKLTVKLVTRIGLTFLKPRVAPWRYVRGGASLDVTLGPSARSGAALGAVLLGQLGQWTCQTEQLLDGGATGGGTAEGDDDDEEEEEIEIVEEVEEVVDVLLQSLRDKDTVVRWSAAKGVGRVTGCLPRELGDEVVEGVMQLFGPTELDSSWHGGCLALAELARRGLLLPNRLARLVPLIASALGYDVRRGPHSIGAHVRDAAAYVCWAFARAYDPQLLEGSVTLLASSLLTLACYDREVNCRRAAAAAFQEAVGRLGNFPHGIALLTVADYFSVGIAQQAYLRVGPQVAAIGPEYRTPLATHLVKVKARHWEKSLRELAARAAAALVPYHASYFAGPALDELLPACLNEQLEVRHGAVVMVAELLPALAAAAASASASETSTAASCSSPPCWPLVPERQAAVAGLVPAIDKARLYRGKGGEVMREAVGRLVERCAGVGLELSAQQHAKVLETLDENLRHPQQYIQTGAVAAVRAYARAYLAGDPRAAAAFRTRYQDAYLTRLHDPNVAVRRGYSLALGSLPAQLLRPVLEEAVDALVDGCVPEEDIDERDVESRVNCTRGLGLLVETMFAESGSGAVGPCREAAEVLQDRVLPCLCASLEDYTTDNRGDVGSWVREAAMGVLAAVVSLLARCYCNGDKGAGQSRDGGSGGGGGGGGDGTPDKDSELGRELTKIAGNAMGLLLRQSVERIGRVRECALRHVGLLLADVSLTPFIPAAVRVAAAVKSAAGAADAGGVAASLEALQRIVVQLLDEPSYTGPLLEGLVASIGGVDNSLAKVASAALLEALAAAPRHGGGDGDPAAVADGATGSGQSLPPSVQPSTFTAVAGHLLDIWSRHAKSPRLATPLLRTALLLVTKAADVAEVQLPRPPPPQAAAAAISEPPSAPPPSSSSSSSSSSPACCSRLVDHLVEVVRAETRGCADVARLVDAGTLLCHLVPYGGHCRTSALQGLMVLLCSRYPKVRRNTAEQLYLQLLALDSSSAVSTAGAATTTTTNGSDAESAAGLTAAASSGGPPSLEQVAEAACDLLLLTSWEGDLDAAKAARDELAALVGVTVPKMKAQAAAGRVAAVARDENASYQALLDDFARGY
ncbi:hypothetical protein VOLCADRAFT_94333 [Volvox carteri f. nagariensis]|uniref:Uncharacterized protein n=1 Tax=Volvox carteri f. nagariensis TaxID=3068 RepID=D8U479_VOLCA|nr:uncharacterized protein VOLCADRAFT_94333 [Volvox carteri f. nagariensis]EFJ45543.1 hypothetical protein VOLCADRAFT_94333 [Volvox carteri f. nagariensis]|eukprot:XP_002953570.1 hypothetical protein VOLCADRAFT_94333 [Volvox carteri f. nagariensis]